MLPPFPATQVDAGLGAGGGPLAVWAPSALSRFDNSTANRTLRARRGGRQKLQTRAAPGVSGGIHRFRANDAGVVVHALEEDHGASGGRGCQGARPDVRHEFIGGQGPDELRVKTQTESSHGGEIIVRFWAAAGDWSRGGCHIHPTQQHRGGLSGSAHAGVPRGKWSQHLHALPVKRCCQLRLRVSGVGTPSARLAQGPWRTASLRCA